MMINQIIFLNIYRRGQQRGDLRVLTSDPKHSEEEVLGSINPKSTSVKRLIVR